MVGLVEQVSETEIFKKNNAQDADLNVYSYSLKFLDSGAN